MTPRETLKRNLRAIRIHQGWTQEMMAFTCGVNRSTYSGWENGGGAPDVDQLQAIADRFKIGADVLLTADISELPTGKRLPILRGSHIGRELGQYLPA